MSGARWLARGTRAGRAAAVCALLALVAANAWADSILTREGPVASSLELDEGRQRAYLGIPYAAAPVGALRFRAPQAARPRDALLQADVRTPGCPQDVSQAYLGIAPARVAEDCLTLNIWAPTAAADKPRPVLVWIHGGGLVQGGALQELPGSEELSYPGANFAARDVVFVSINYRLGPFGFLALRELAGEHADHPAAGNYGFLDQVAALQWVRDNIAAFGGDPDQVTLFGQSAGAVSVCAHLASPLSRGLFRRAILQSGNCLKSMPRLATAHGGVAAAYTQGDRVRLRLGCVGNTAAIRHCLRSKSMADIISAGQATAGFGGSGEFYQLAIDNYAFKRSLADSIADGSAAAVPILVGVTADEANTLVSGYQRPPSVLHYAALVHSSLPHIAPAVLARYPVSDYDAAWKAWAAILTDTVFVCPARQTARDHAARGNAVYAYYLTQHWPGPYADLGAFHGLDIPLLFSTAPQANPAMDALAEGLRDRWVAFAKTGVPNPSGALAWPRHPPQADLGLELSGAGDRVIADYRQARCDFWAQYSEP